MLTLTVRTPILRYAWPGFASLRNFAVAVWLLLAIGLSSCGGDSGSADAYSGPLYPGAGLRFEFDDEDLDLAAEFGEISTDAGRVWYNAPLNNTVDRYSIAYAGSGKQLAAGDITVDMLPLAELELLEADAESDVRGRYGEVQFSASGTDAVRGSARFTMPGSALTLTVSIDGDAAAMEWDGVRIDGYGALADDERQAVRALSTHAMARAITMVALDLGCHADAQQLDGAAFAALLYPWQVILKYEIGARGRVIRHFLDESTCQFSGYTDDDVGEALNTAVFWDDSNPIPTTLWLFPFDGAGQRKAGP